MKSLLVPANIDRLEEVTGFVNELLGDVDMKTEFQIRLAVEELRYRHLSHAPL